MFDPLAVSVDKMFDLAQVGKFTREGQRSRWSMVVRRSQPPQVRVSISQNVILPTTNGQRLTTFVFRLARNQLQRMRQQIHHGLERLDRARRTAGQIQYQAGAPNAAHGAA